MGKHSYEAENKLAFFFVVISPLNLLDYGVRAIFGEVSKWPKEILLVWAAISVCIFPLALLAALRINISRKSLEKAIQVGIAPCILLVYYALPSEFTVLKIEKPRNNGNRPPIHLIVFDMLSYDFLLRDSAIVPDYPNFESFSHEADVFVNAYSPAGSTGPAITRILTGIDFAEVSHASTQWIARTQNSSRTFPISSFKTLFSMADKEGYNVFLRAFALPYLDNFGGHIQSGRILPFDTLWRVGMHSLIWPILSPGGLQHQETVNAILNDYVTRVHQDSRNTLFYTHWNIPHDPFIYDGDGNPLNRLELTKGLIIKPDRKQMYQHQLVGTDAVFGWLIQAMKDSGTYNESLVIVTSDHNIGGFGFEMDRVPLLIKRPHQRRSRIIHSRVTTLKVLDYIKYFVQSGRSENKILVED